MAGSSRLYSYIPSVPFAAFAESEQRFIDLQRLQKAVQQINSILDLEVLLDQVINGVAQDFRCTEASIHLKDPLCDELVLEAVRGCSLHGRGHRTRIGSPKGLISQAAATRQVLYTPDVRHNARYIPCEKDILSELDIPLMVEGELIGVFSASHPEADGFSPERIELFRTLADHLAVAVTNARRFQEQRRQNERLELEQQEARKVQLALLPRQTPLLPHLRIEAASTPARAVSGDWYDYVPMSDGRWGFVLADVAGKGLGAALLMTSVRSVLRSVAFTATTPHEVLNRLNRFLVNDLPEGRYVTLVFAVFDPANRTIAYANAGHPRPLLEHGGVVTPLDAVAGPPLGLFDSTYESAELRFTPGSRLLLYSDGITEAENAAGEEFGSVRLGELLSHSETELDCILSAVQIFSNDTALDDATVLLLQDDRR